ncbi:MAG: hypothetical protein CFE21_06040 [Bacteroidetes bacterium B1(2017)]|nr:MAG: hypothetical protein CFE21_06040 [Bacteroidetes bacterium B1(2017)]
MKLSKEQAAISQLCDAIELFCNGKYVSAITLAAASEEVLAQLVNIHSKKTGIPYSTAEDTEAAMFYRFKDFLGIRNYHAYRNKIKNELKHHGDLGNKDFLTGNFKQIALNHIAGSIVNYKTIYNKLTNEKKITEFCLEIGLS